MMNSLKSLQDLDRAVPNEPFSNYAVQVLNAPVQTFGLNLQEWLLEKFKGWGCGVEIGHLDG